MRASHPTRSARLAAALCLGVMLTACAGGAAAPTVDPESAQAEVATGIAIDDAAPSTGELRGATDADLHGVTASDGTVVVAGVAADGPAIWSAGADRRLRRGHVAAADEVRRLEAVAVTGSSGVAFGGDGTGSSRSWHTDDLATWQPVDPSVSGIDGRVAAVTTDGRRWLAVGDRVDPEGGEAYEGVVWSSQDGQTFAPAVDGLELDEGTLTDVVVADGTLVVVGFDVTGGRVWTSVPDADTTPAQGAFAGSTIEGVAATADGFVALGRGIGDLRARTWTSPDGRTWRDAVVDGSALAPTEEIGDVTTLDGVPVAVGSSGAVWWLDGDVWRRR